MKTSYILLVLVAIIALTGMVTADVLLKRQYEKIDWNDPLQHFDHRALPVARHVVIEGAPISEIIVEQSTDSAQVLLVPSMANSYKARLKGDTLFVAFTMNYDGQSRNPHNDINYELPAGMVLRLPDLQSLRVTNGRLTVRNSTLSQLALSVQNTRLRTHKLAVSGEFRLTAGQNSFALLGNDRYNALQTIVNDSSGVQLDDSQVNAFTKQVSPRAEIQLKGQALKWLK